MSEHLLLRHPLCHLLHVFEKGRHTCSVPLPTNLRIPTAVCIRQNYYTHLFRCPCGRGVVSCERDPAPASVAREFGIDLRNAARAHKRRVVGNNESVAKLGTSSHSKFMAPQSTTCLSVDFLGGKDDNEEEEEEGEEEFIADWKQCAPKHIPDGVRCSSFRRYSKVSTGSCAPLDTPVFPESTPLTAEASLHLKELVRSASETETVKFDDGKFPVHTAGRREPPPVSKVSKRSPLPSYTCVAQYVEQLDDRNPQYVVHYLRAHQLLALLLHNDFDATPCSSIQQHPTTVRSGFLQVFKQPYHKHNTMVQVRWADGKVQKIAIRSCRAPYICNPKRTVAYEQCTTFDGPDRLSVLIQPSTCDELRSYLPGKLSETLIPLCNDVIRYVQVIEKRSVACATLQFQIGLEENATALRTEESATLWFQYCSCLRYCDDAAVPAIPALRFVIPSQFRYRVSLRPKHACIHPEDLLITPRLDSRRYSHTRNAAHTLGRATEMSIREISTLPSAQTTSLRAVFNDFVQKLTSEEETVIAPDLITERCTQFIHSCISRYNEVADHATNEQQRLGTAPIDDALGKNQGNRRPHDNLVAAHKVDERKAKIWREGPFRTVLHAMNGSRRVPIRRLKELQVDVRGAVRGRGCQCAPERASSIPHQRKKTLPKRMCSAVRTLPSCALEPYGDSVACSVRSLIHYHRTQGRRRNRGERCKENGSKK